MDFTSCESCCKCALLGLKGLAAHEGSLRYESKRTQAVVPHGVVPGITYAAEVWYTGVYQPSGHTRKKGLVVITNKLRSTQCKVEKTITWALATMADDVLDVHTFLLLLDLMFSKVLFGASSCVCTLLDTHLLYKVVQRAVL